MLSTRGSILRNRGVSDSGIRIYGTLYSEISGTVWSELHTNMQAVYGLVVKHPSAIAFHKYVKPATFKGTLPDEQHLPVFGISEQRVWIESRTKVSPELVNGRLQMVRICQIP